MRLHLPRRLGFVQAALALLMLAVALVASVQPAHASTTAVAVPASPAAAAAPATPHIAAYTTGCDRWFADRTHVSATATFDYSGGYAAVRDTLARWDGGEWGVQIWQHSFGASRLAGGTLYGYGDEIRSGSHWEPVGTADVIRFYDPNEGFYQTCVLYS